MERFGSEKVRGFGSLSLRSGTQFTKAYCQYDCITSLGEGMKILLGKQIPVTGIANDYINNNLKDFTGKNKISFNTRYANGNIKDKTVAGFSIDIGQAMLDETLNEKGVHFFVASLANADHAVMFAVRNTGEKSIFYKMDNISDGFITLGDKNQLDNWIKKFYQQNTEVGTGNRLDERSFMKKIEKDSAPELIRSEYTNN